MPTGWGGPSTINIANVLINADVTIPTAYKLKCDEIDEATASHGTILQSGGATAMVWAVMGGGG